MVKRDVVAAKVAEAARRLDAAEQIFGRPLADFVADEEGRDLATFYIFLAIQECIDIAAHWVADAGWRLPEDATVTFDVLAAKGRLTAELATAMRGAVGLRNRVAHNYPSVDPERIYEEYRDGTRALREYLLVAAEEVGL